MRRSILTLGLLVASALLASAWAEAPGRGEKKAADHPQDKLGPVFEQLKKLVGEWQLAKPADEASKGKTAVRYRLTAGGSALVETIFPDEAMEMLSVYHRDGDKLVLTHYCCAGNQPKMQATIGKNKDEVAFEFAGGSSLNPDKDMHIHCGRIRFVDADRIHSEWEYYINGKAAGKHAFDLVRKK